MALHLSLSYVFGILASTVGLFVVRGKALLRLVAACVSTAAGLALLQLFVGHVANVWRLDTIIPAMLGTISMWALVLYRGRSSSDAGRGLPGE